MREALDLKLSISNRKEEELNDHMLKRLRKKIMKSTLQLRKVRRSGLRLMLEREDILKKFGSRSLFSVICAQRNCQERIILKLTN